MPRARKAVENLEGKVASGKKKFVDYKQGQELYSLGEALFRQIAHDADAIYRVKRRVLINTELVDEYMEVFHERNNS